MRVRLGAEARLGAGCPGFRPAACIRATSDRWRVGSSM